MTRFVCVFSLIFLLGLSACSQHERDVKGTALANFAAGCTGGSYPACKAGCEDKYGTAVTTTNLVALNSCLTGCNTSCNVTTLCVQLQQSCKSNCSDYYNNCVLILGAAGVGQ
ncbi:hypothetical protein ACE5IS_03695 [Leptospira wolffii]|uniref:Lipoprotein n=1 Tax=Leptospira wolffii TaxID=409998 RepID=A0ABV5BKV6_9LEPT|nr:hypothetical protein [Leptospira wolffii]TGK60037.1 hypothetical protein EHQ32_08995 [Leptospira wolffii]TGK72381.1 hypothetical protein EHQ27_07920 [Leptospira wolffii]TGK76044.1 hypothetical protein EHQ35_01745 [Leptospira wolffii]TGL30296.1 hypothetical protein EHQ57_07715 [Leptospira wolffii]